MNGPLGSVYHDAVAEYGRLSMEYAVIVARNYTLTQKDLDPEARPCALTKEQSERIGQAQHVKHVALYESRRRLEDLITALSTT